MQTGVKIGLGLAAFALASFGGYKIYRKVKARKDIKDFERGGYDVNTGKKSGKNTPAINSINLVEVAMSVAHDLGTAYNALDPRRWTENDDAVERALLKVPKPLFPELVNIYYNKYKRNLVEDLMSSLDSDNLARVKYLWT